MRNSNRTDDGLEVGVVRVQCRPLHSLLDPERDASP